MEIILYTMTGTLLLIYAFNAVRFYSGSYKGKIFKEIYSNFIEFWFKYNFKHNASESAYFKNQFGTHRIVYNSYLNENYQPIHSFITIYTTKGVLICYNLGNEGEISGKDSDKNLIVRRDGKAFRIPGTKAITDKHLATVKTTVPEGTEIKVCYFFKKDADHSRFKTDCLTASYEEIADVIRTLNGHLSDEAVIAGYDAATSHLLKEKR